MIAFQFPKSKFPMRRLSLCAALVAAALASLPAKADTCFPPFTSLDVFQTVSKDNAQFSHRLKTRIPQALFVTHATLEGKLNERQLELAFHFRTGGTSQPYNIFAVLVAAGGQPLAWHDLTKGCTGLPSFLFPRAIGENPAGDIAVRSDRSPYRRLGPALTHRAFRRRPSVAQRRR
jgi:hypothetical protein